MVSPITNADDFIVLANIPTKNLEYYKLYEISHTNNVYEGKNFSFLNVPMKDIIDHTLKSITSDIPVWFGADVNKDFNPYHSTLDDKLSDEKVVFGDTYNISKGDRISFNNLEANHAMSIVGVNLGISGSPDSWQVENSWGFLDNTTPGLDGFLYMSHSWFEKNVIEVTIHKRLLSRSITKHLGKTYHTIKSMGKLCSSIEDKFF